MMMMCKMYGTTGTRIKILVLAAVFTMLCCLNACRRGEDPVPAETSEIPASEDTGETVSVPEGGLQFVLPDGWEYECSEEGDLLIRPQVSSMVEVSVRWFYRTGSVQKYQKQMKQAWCEIVHDFDDTVAVTQTRVGNLDGFLMSFAQSSEDFDAVCYEVYTVWDSDTQMYYSILFVGAQEYFEDNSDTVQAMLESFIMTPAPAPQEQVFSDTSLEFSFTYDGMWRCIDGSTATILAPDLISTISVECSDSQEVLSSEAIIGEAKRMIRESTDNPRDIVLEPVSILGVEGVQGNFTADYQGYGSVEKAQYQFYIFYMEGKRFYLVYASTPEQFATYLPELTHVVESLVIVPQED